MSRLVTLSESASIGIHAMVLIARTEGKLNSNTIAELTGASRNTVAKVLLLLAKNNFIESTRGPKGGFVLKKPATAITLYDIYTAIEGLVIQNSCPMDKQVCPFGKCIMGGIANKVSDEMVDYFKNQTIDNLVN